MSLLQVGTNLTDLTLKRRRVTVRELGGCMGPIWPSYFKDCSSVIVCPSVHYPCLSESYSKSQMVNIYHQMFCFFSSIVCGGFGKYCPDILLLYPAAVCALC